MKRISASLYVSVTMTFSLASLSLKQYMVNIMAYLHDAHMVTTINLANNVALWRSSVNSSMLSLL